jgi:hypothetical protein
MMAKNGLLKHIGHGVKMKTFQLKKDSWHYKLANFGVDHAAYRVYESSDICSYIRYVMYGLFWFLVVSTIVLALGGFALYSIGNLIGWLFLGYILESGTIGFFIIIGAFSLFIGTTAAVMITKDRMQHEEPGFVRLAYRSWKNKFCAKVELV